MTPRSRSPHSSGTPGSREHRSKEEEEEEDEEEEDEGAPVRFDDIKLAQVTNLTHSFTLWASLSPPPLPLGLSLTHPTPTHPTHPARQHGPGAPLPLGLSLTHSPTHPTNTPPPHTPQVNTALAHLQAAQLTAAEDVGRLRGAVAALEQGAQRHVAQVRPGWPAWTCPSHPDVCSHPGTPTLPQPPPRCALVGPPAHQPVTPHHFGQLHLLVRLDMLLLLCVCSRPGTPTPPLCPAASLGPPGFCSLLSLPCPPTALTRS